MTRGASLHRKLASAVTILTMAVVFLGLTDPTPENWTI